MFINTFNPINKCTKGRYQILLPINLWKINMIANHKKCIKKQIKPQHRYFLEESLLLKTPLSSIVYSTRNHETITMHSSHKSLLHLFSYRLTLIQTKSGQHLANYQPVFRLPCSRNSWWMEYLFFRNFSLPQLR